MKTKRTKKEIHHYPPYKKAKMGETSLASLKAGELFRTDDGNLWKYLHGMSAKCVDCGVVCYIRLDTRVVRENG